MLKANKIKMYRVHHNIDLNRMGHSLNLSPDYLSSLERKSKKVTLRVEDAFFRIYEPTFDRFDKEIFKERYPYDNIKLKDYNSIKTLKKQRS